MEPEIQVAPDGERVRIGGVVYSLAFFRAMAARLPAGTHVDVVRHPAGNVTLHHFVPRGSGTP